MRAERTSQNHNTQQKLALSFTITIKPHRGGNTYTVSSEVVGRVGALVGDRVGCRVGVATVGTLVVGALVGDREVGVAVGMFVGARVG